MICSLRSSHTESRLLAGGLRLCWHILLLMDSCNPMAALGLWGGMDDQNLPLHCIIELNGTTSINLH